ncbi:MAG: hypothetical protein ACRC7G_12365 [Beijerinckiaceae bacterium]
MIIAKHGDASANTLQPAQERIEVFIMPTDRSSYQTATERLASREELTRFYRAIGIPAVASAAQAAKMAGQALKSAGAMPAFLQDAHRVG